MAKTVTKTAVEIPPKEEKKPKDEIHQWRLESFVELGFTEREAGKLANALVRDEVKTKTGSKKYERPLHRDQVKKMIDQGASHKKIVAIFT